MLDGGIIPVLLSDGEGSPLWPLSRETYPKQLLSVLDGKTPLRQSALQVTDRSLFAEPIVIANAERRFFLGEQLREIGISQGTIVLEPLGRGDPSTAIAGLLAERSNPDAILLAMPVGSAIMWRSRPRSATAWRPRATLSESGTSIIVSKVGVGSPQEEGSQ